MDKRETGTVRRYDKTKGYGFIEPDYRKDIFVHQSALIDVRWLKEGRRVEFRVVVCQNSIWNEIVLSHHANQLSQSISNLKLKGINYHFL